VRTSEGSIESVDFISEREKMVQTLITEGLLKTREVIDAMRRVPRELFVSQNMTGYAYNDTPLPTEYGQTISAPLG
jgi:protein-L-isoaspartate(D-aspartate) O-methyltransferase